MNTEATAEKDAGIEAEIEVLELLRKTCRTMRGNRNRPVLAGPAAQWEVRINHRLDELLRTQTPALPLKTAKAA